MTNKDKLKLLSELTSAIIDLKSKAADDKKGRLASAQKLTKVLAKLVPLNPITVDEVRQKGRDAKEADTDNVEMASVDDSAAEDEYSDNPNDENYRYADTGYIAGSHKERASNRIKDLAKEGITVKATDIEWDEIEADPLIAEDMIKKSNILGDVDYQALKDKDVDAGTAYLIQKVLASIGADPHWDIMTFLKNSNSGRRIIGGRNENRLRIAAHYDAISIAEQKSLARKAYVNGINTLKSRLTDNINIVTTKDLIAELKAISSELAGHTISALDEGEYDRAVALVAAQRELIESKSSEFFSEYKEAEKQALESMGESTLSDNAVAEYKHGKFQVVEITNAYKLRLSKQESMKAWFSERYPSIEFSGRYNQGPAPLVLSSDKEKYKQLVNDVERITLTNKLAALSDPLSSLAWVALGERFWNIVELTSGAFVKHANLAINGKYNDWDLTIKPDTTSSVKSKKKGKNKTTFELIVADNIERIGGDPVTIRSTEELKDAFGFRDIQSGNWVLKDKSSAKFHVENAAASMMDLSDIVGINPKSLAFGGRLALALGARGSKGALAHYEPVQRVINITKMKGGGSLGHEWFHAIDNILGEVLGADGATGAGKFLSIEPDLVADKSSNLARAFADLQNTMKIGDVRSPETFRITDRDVKLALLNIKDVNGGLGKLIFDAKDATEAVNIVDNKFGSNRSKRSKNHSQWRKVAVAFFNQNKVGEAIVLNVGEKTSEFYANSKKLDAERSKPYWSTTHEMAARAFQAFLEDSLKDRDRRNDYLSYGANNSLYGGGHQAYPEGEERKRINLAFKSLFEVIKSEKIFENASADEAMMDAVFGAPSILFDEEQLELNRLFAGEY